MKYQLHDVDEIIETSGYRNLLEKKEKKQNSME